MSTPLSNSNRRSSLTFSPKRSISNEDQGSSPNQTATNSVERKTSFVTKTTVFLEPERKRSNAGVSGSNPAGAAGHLNLEIPDLNSERVKFDSSSLPTSPTSEEISTTSSVGGGMKLVHVHLYDIFVCYFGMIECFIPFWYLRFWLFLVTKLPKYYVIVCLFFILSLQTENIVQKITQL